ncbi:MAG: DNA primase [Chloroflexi bacterium]|nr:MAG: DNA primase [Chloroflexota bacterium]
MSVTDEVKQRIDIVDLISRYTPLKRSGNTYKGLCPFHTERTPSFIVFPHSGTWRCFGACGVGGDVFSFVMRKENLDFREALHLLAREAGVDLAAVEGHASSQQRTSLYEINEAAANYFREILHHHPAAQPARDYLRHRGIDDAARERFQLGFALESWSSLRDYLSEKGFGLEQQLLAGLAKRNEERDSTYDAFRNRVIYPIRDRQGRIIGFGGRVLDKSEPKYLNTAETPLFHKSRVIYGLDLAHQAIRSADRVVIVEGYMDVIAAHQHGFANVVACMGTSLTADQLQQLQRYTTNFVLALDADAAGQQATIRGLNQARQALGHIHKPTVTASGILMEARLGANLFICAMPPGQDPDDVIRHDPSRWRQLVQDALPLVDFYFDIVGHQYDLASVQGKGQAVADLAPLIAELQDEIEQQHYVDQLSRWVRIEEQTIWDRVRAVARTRSLAAGRTGPKRSPLQLGSGRHRRPPSQEPAAAEAPVEAPLGAGIGDGATRASRYGREEYLLTCLLHEPDLLVWLAGASTTLEIDPLRSEDFQNVELQEIFRALKQFMTSDEQWEIELFQETLTPHLHGRLAELIVYGAQLPPRTEVEQREDLVRTLIRMRIDRLSVESKNIKFLEDEAVSQGDLEGSKQWSAIKNRHVRELYHLQQSRQQAGRLLFRRRQPEQGVRLG